MGPPMDPRNSQISKYSFFQTFFHLSHKDDKMFLKKIKKSFRTLKYSKILSSHDSTIYVNIDT